MKVITSIDNKISESILARKAIEEARYSSSGLVSSTKIAKPTLWAVLDMLGEIPDEKDAYTYRKFHRGDDVHARAKEYLTGILIPDQVDGESVEVKEQPLTGILTLEKEAGYRGGTGFIDVDQVLDDGVYVHEIKSSTKEAYDRIAKTAYDFGIKGKVFPKGPSLGHLLQLAYLIKARSAKGGVLHYLNSNDYRMVSFYISLDGRVAVQNKAVPLGGNRGGSKTAELIDRAKELHPDHYDMLDLDSMVDESIDAIYSAFNTSTMPEFEAKEYWQTLPKYQSYREWNELSSGQIVNKLKTDYPKAYKKFMDSTFGG